MNSDGLDLDELVRLAQQRHAEERARHSPQSRLRHCPVKTMAVDTDADRARRGFAAAMQGDMTALGDLLHPEVRWHGGDPQARGACHNRREALDFLRRARDRGRFAELVDVVGTGPSVVVILRARDGGAPPADPHAVLVTFREGRAVEMVHYPSPQDALEAAGLER